MGTSARELVTEPPALAEEQISLVRLRNQCIAAPTAALEGAGERSCAGPRAVVERLGALQGQDYAGVLWSIGLRIPGVTASDVERAFADREIVRTWPMRGTLHVIPAADARWMLELLTPRVIERTARRRENLALDREEIARAAKLFEGALRGGNRLTREEMMALLENSGIVTAGQRGYHLLFHLSMQRLINFGPRAGTQQTFVLFDEWLPRSHSLPRSEALAILVRRYFTSHGPASVKDFVGWSGLSVADAKAGLADNADTLVARKLGGAVYWMSHDPSAVTTGSAMPTTVPDVHLLPGFDEYLLGYKDRSAQLSSAHSELIVPGGNGVFRPTVVVDGQVVGTWKRVGKKGAVTVEATPFGKFTATQQHAIDSATKRYLAFIAE